jgi:hypothetical protein
MLIRRNKCAACAVVANDIDVAKRSRNMSAVTLEAILGDDEYSFCDTLGYNHSPYVWLESVCEEMLDNRLGEYSCAMVVAIDVPDLPILLTATPSAIPTAESILEVVAFHEQVANTGFTPDQTMPQMMCEEFYGCDNDFEQTKKPKKVQKKSKKPAKATSGSSRKDL